MKSLRSMLTLVPVLLVGGLLGCSSSPTQSPDVTDSVRRSLDQAGYKDVSVSQDRDKGVVTLSGTVASESDKAQAESLVKAAAGGQVVANTIAVRPPGDESAAKAVDSDLDKAIEKNLDAALVKRKLDKGVHYDVKNGVVTLKGYVGTQNRRAAIEQVASSVPNVRQVVNEMEVKGQKATSSRH
jgi:hyperosmotically inducible periplasmic protein